MKALIRKKNELITERFEIPWVDWKTGAPLTNPEWCGGPYTLVQNYVPPREDTPEQCEVDEPEPVVEENEDDYVVIDGKRYSKAELRSLIE